MNGIEVKEFIYYLRFAFVLSVVNLFPIQVAAGRRKSK